MWVLFCLAKGLYLGVFGMFAGCSFRRNTPVIAIPALWVGIERIPGPFFYTWLTLGNAGIDMAVPMRLAPLTGVYGFLSCLRFSEPPLHGLRCEGRESRLSGLRYCWSLLLPSLPNPAQPTRSAVTVQPNIEERDNWTSPEAQALHQRLGSLSLQSGLTPRRDPISSCGRRCLPRCTTSKTPPCATRLQNLARFVRAPLIAGTVGQTG